MEIKQSHIVENIEDKFLLALQNNDKYALAKCSHPTLVVKNEEGNLYEGIAALLEVASGLLNFENISQLERQIVLFDNVAVVNTTEERKLVINGTAIVSHYQIMRVWQFTEEWWLISMVTENRK